MEYGLNKILYCGINLFIYKVDKNKVGVRHVANTPLYTPKTLKETVGGVKLTDYYTHDRKVPSYMEAYNLLTGKPIFSFPFNYFENNEKAKNYGEIYGRCQGVGIDNRPEQESWLDGVITKDFRLDFGNDMAQLASWERMNAPVGFAPALILLKDGKPRKLYSEASGWGKYTNKNTQTFIAQDKETIYLGVVDGLIYASTVAVYLENFGVTDVCFGDAGGSAYAYYHEENEPTEEITNTTETGIYLHVNSIGMYIRKTLEFKGTKSAGQILKTVRVGERAKILEFVKGIQPDGFQWVKVEFKGVVGFSQYDSACYWLEKKG